VRFSVGWHILYHHILLQTMSVLLTYFSSMRNL
jgi:hypothetical protein